MTATTRLLLRLRHRARPLTRYLTRALRALAWALDHSVPLLLGIGAALFLANAAPDAYRRVSEAELFGVSLRFLVNDVFMALFFAMAAAEVEVSVREGGALHPWTRALNPMFASIGGVVGPALVYIAAITVLFKDDPDQQQLLRAWGVPTATDVALAWLAARFVFGRRHPALSFLLVLAIVDDVIGMLLVATVYSHGSSPLPHYVAWLVPVGLLVAWALRARGVREWPLYLFVAGGLVWVGALGTPLHPALALVPVVLFLPNGPEEPAPARRLEDALHPWVEAGLGVFGFVNAGAQLGGAGMLTFVLLFALVAGKTVGITFASWVAEVAGFPRPDGLGRHAVVVVGFLASIGLTVSLFIVDEALPAGFVYRDAARMGAVLSLGVVGVAYLERRALRGWIAADGTAASAVPAAFKHPANR